MGIFSRKSCKGVEEAWSNISSMEAVPGAQPDAPSGHKVVPKVSLKTTDAVNGIMTQDSSKFLSADIEGDGDEQDDDNLALPPSYPLPLVFFVALLALVSGFVVMGVHKVVLYSGCPLGLNGCNSSHDLDEAVLLRVVKDAFSDKVPEDVVYISTSVFGALVFTEIWKRVPEDLAFQVRGGGAIQALVAVAGGRRIILTAAVLRIFVTSIYLGTSGTLGLDGPAIHVCTAVTSNIGWVLGMRGFATQSLLSALGFAGAFAASFNSPLAGIMFAMEELQHVSSSVSRHIIGIILIASVIATAVVRLVQGDEAMLDADWDQEGFAEVFGPNMWMLVCIPISIVCSLFGFALSKVLEWSWRLLDMGRKRVPYRCLIVGTVMSSALIGCAVFRITGLRGVWGIGFESLQEAFDKEILGSHFIVFGVGKAIAMMLSVAVSCPGDILEPVLISGGFIGGGIGCLLQEIIEDEVLASQVVKPCLVFGMVSLFASCFRFPLTPVVMVLEFMGEETYAIVLPTALAGFTAITVSNRLFPPLLDSVMHRDGIDLDCIRDESEAAASEREDIMSETELELGSDHSFTPSEHSGTSKSSGASSFQLGIHLESSMMSLAGRQTSRGGGSSQGSERGGRGSGSSRGRHRQHLGSGSSGMSRQITGSEASSRASSRNNSHASNYESSGTNGTIVNMGIATLNLPNGAGGSRSAASGADISPRRLAQEILEAASERRASNAKDVSSEGPTPAPGHPVPPNKNESPGPSPRMTPQRSLDLAGTVMVPTTEVPAALPAAVPSECHPSRDATQEVPVEVSTGPPAARPEASMASSSTCDARRDDNNAAAGEQEEEQRVSDATRSAVVARPAEPDPRRDEDCPRATQEQKISSVTSSAGVLGPDTSQIRSTATDAGKADNPSAKPEQT